jgi:hypothetical protein
VQAASSEQAMPNRIWIFMTLLPTGPSRGGMTRR